MSTTRIYARWEELDVLLKEALARPPEEVDAYCRDACGDDRELYELLTELVDSADISDEALRNSVSRLAEDMAGDHLLTGQRAGAYRFEELIGRGGMGDVYLASRADGAFSKKVAVKIIRERLATDVFVRHFQTERQALADFHHSSIPTLIDAGQLEDGRPYFISDYVEGLPIDEYCETHRLSVNARLDLLRRVGEALQHAHNKLVLHLDIKPDNVLVQPDGTPSLLDFGVARLIGQGQDEHHAFSPGYASPEQIRGDRVSAASDVYSLGALMFHLFAGEAPFSSPRFAPSQTILAERAALAERLQSLSTLKEIDADLQAVIRKSMAESPNDRYATVESFLLDLKYYRNDLPVSARTKTFAYRLGKYVRRHRLSIGVVAVSFVALAGFGLREAELRLQAQEASAAASRDAETARQVSDFMVDLFEVSDPSEARGNSVTARELLDHGAERIAADLASQPLVAAEMMEVMGKVYVNLGLREQAVALYEEALEFRKTASPGPDADSAELLRRIGGALTRLARFEEAEEVLMRALNEQENAAGPLAVKVAILETLGSLYLRMGRYAEAEQAHLRAIPIAESVFAADHPEIAKQLSALARVYYAQGRNENAEPLYLRSIDILERAFGTDYPDLGIYYENIGNLYNHMERYDEAISYLTRGLALRERSLEADHPMLSYSLVNLSAVYINLDRLDEAEPHLQRAIAIQEKIFDPQDYRLALSRMNMGELHLKRGELAEAERLALTAMNAMEQSLQPGHNFLGFAAQLLAMIYDEMEQPAKAGNYFARGFAVFGSRPADDPVRRQFVEKYLAYLRENGRSDEAEVLASQP